MKGRPRTITAFYTARRTAIQRFFHLYTFTNIPGEPGGDPWDLLSFDEEAERFGDEFVENIRQE